MESFNGKLRDEALDRKVFYTLPEVHVLTDRYARPAIASDRTVRLTTSRRLQRQSGPKIPCTCWSA